MPCVRTEHSISDLQLLIPSITSRLLGPFYGAIAVLSVTRCRCRGHRCADDVSSDTWWMAMRRAAARSGEWAQYFSNNSCLTKLQPTMFITSSCWTYRCALLRLLLVNLLMGTDHCVCTTLWSVPLLSPFYGTIAVLSVTRCRCRYRRGHRCAGGVRQ